MKQAGNIIFSLNGFYVELIKDTYHVFTPGVTHASCDSAYKFKELAIDRCKYLETQFDKYGFKKVNPTH